jgi:hypothetical protein
MQYRVRKAWTSKGDYVDGVVSFSFETDWSWNIEWIKAKEWAVE